MAKPGPKTWQPTPEERAQVELLVAIGYTLPQIATVTGKSETSLKTHCREELDNGALKVNSLVAGQLFKKCMADDTASIIFWMKTRLGWKEPKDEAVAGEVHVHLHESAD